MEMLFGSLLISGSKVRVLDGPPMKAGASRASEAPADFRAADVGSVTPKSDESARPINNGQTRDRKDPLARIIRECTRQRPRWPQRSEEHTSELQSRLHLVCRL